MIQTFHPLDAPTGDEFHQAARILRRDHGAEKADRRAIMICLYRGSETRWPSAEFVNRDPLGMGRAEWTHEWLTEFPNHG